MAARPGAPSLVERMNSQPDWEEAAVLDGIEVIPDDLNVAELLDDPDSRTSYEEPAEAVEFEIIDEGEDGVVVDFDPQAEVEEEPEFDANLAEHLDERLLGVIAGDMKVEYEHNLRSRQEWQEAFTDGLKLLGFNYDERSEPFEGASGVTHPIMAEAAYQFQAQAYNEIMPSKGPVRTVVIGNPTYAKRQQAQRMQEFMNFYLTDRMDEYDSETDQMLFYLPLAGSTFKKIWYDGTLARAVSCFVPAEDLVVPYGASNLETAESVIQRLRMSINEVNKRKASGFYRDVELQATRDNPNVDTSELTGQTPAESSDTNEEVTLLECHVNYDIEGFEDYLQDAEEPSGIRLPYIITLDLDSLQVLAIRRNYDADDDLKRKINYFVHYKFLPGLGFYGVGLIHTIGGLSRTATAALRQLIDAGTLANLPAGFKLRELRVANDDKPLQPGEWRDVDSSSGTIRDSLYPLPYKEPSQTLFMLLGFVVEAAQRFATITNLKVGESDQQLAHGTVIALIEQGSRVMSAIHKRLHAAVRKELKVLHRIISDHIADEGYPYEVEGAEQTIKQEDFDNSVGVLPVSDPNIFSSTQRILLAQSQMEVAANAPQLYIMSEVHRRYLEALGAKDVDAVLRGRKQNTDIPLDPAQENINALDEMDMQAFEGQDHEGHIVAHMVFGSSGSLQSMPLVGVLLQKHVMDHVRVQAREEAMQAFEQAGQQTDMESPEFEGIVANLVGQGMMRVKELGEQINNVGQQQEPDPVIALKEKELEQLAQQNEAGNALKEQQLQQANANNVADRQLEERKMSADIQDKQRRIDVARERIRSQEQQALLRNRQVNRS